LAQNPARNDIVLAAYREWLTNDPVAARAWTSTRPLPPTP
jgi:hypothetical protein